MLENRFKRAKATTKKDDDISLFLLRKSIIATETTHFLSLFLFPEFLKYAMNHAIMNSDFLCVNNIMLSFTLG